MILARRHSERALARKFSFFAALRAALTASIVFLAFYYLTLALLPSAFAFPRTLWPFAAWAHRLDLAQFFGTILIPPLPTWLTWIVGFFLFFAAYVAFGVAYKLLLAWSVQRSELRHGVGFGVLLFLGIAFAVWLASGFQPAVMRSALPDTGFFLLGWSAWATLQLLLAHVLYGAMLGTVARHLEHHN